MTCPIEPVLLVDPLVAKDLKEVYGFDTKEKLSQWLHENVKLIAGEFCNYSLVHSLTSPSPDDVLSLFANRLAVVIRKEATGHSALAGDFLYGNRKKVYEHYRLNGKL